MKLIRTIYYKQEYYQVFNNDDRVYFSISSKEHTVTPYDNSISYSLEEFNTLYYTRFDHISHLINQLKIIHEYILRQFIQTITQKLERSTFLYATAHRLFGNHLSSDIDPEMLVPSRTERGSYLQVLMDQDIIIFVLLNVTYLSEEHVIASFHKSFLKVFFQSNADIELQETAILRDVLTRKTANFYIFHKNQNCGEIERFLKSLERKQKIKSLM